MAACAQMCCFVFTAPSQRSGRTREGPRALPKEGAEPRMSANPRSWRVRSCHDRHDAPDRFDASCDSTPSGLGNHLRIPEARRPGCTLCLRMESVAFPCGTTEAPQVYGRACKKSDTMYRTNNTRRGTVAQSNARRTGFRRWFSRTYRARRITTSATATPALTPRQTSHEIAIAIARPHTESRVKRGLYSQ